MSVRDHTKRHQVARVLGIVAAVIAILCALTTFGSMLSLSTWSDQGIEAANERQRQLRDVKKDLQPSMDRLKSILKGETRIDDQNDLFAAYENIGAQSAIYREQDAYIHADAFIESCDVSDDHGTISVAYECAAITANSDKVDIVSRTRVRMDVERREGTWVIVAVHSNDILAGVNGGL